jgi:uncharacterized protein YceK
MNVLAKSILSFIVLIVINGCSTIYTVSTEPEILKREACINECSIPRVYSGSSFAICGINEKNSGQGGAIMFWDLLLSVPADTVILPFTAFMQVKEGSISNGKICSQTITSNKPRHGVAKQ